VKITEVGVQVQVDAEADHCFLQRFLDGSAEIIVHTQTRIKRRRGTGEVSFSIYYGKKLMEFL
jgi:hypothetical protein